MMQLYNIASVTKKYLIIFLADKYGEGINCEFENGAEVRFFARTIPSYEFVFQCFSRGNRRMGVLYGWLYFKGPQKYANTVM